MEPVKKKIIIILFVLGVGVFGYSQYASASQIEMSITRSDLLHRSDTGASYDIELQFQNPSLLMLTAGNTEFFVTSDGGIIGKGELEPFTLQPLDTALAKGTFHTDSDTNGPKSVKITGTTKYDMLITSLNIPFVYYPTEEQAREFIHQD